jgi:hypothetical protein
MINMVLVELFIVTLTILTAASMQNSLLSILPNLTSFAKYIIEGVEKVQIIKL